MNAQGPSKKPVVDDFDDALAAFEGEQDAQTGTQAHAPAPTAPAEAKEVKTNPPKTERTYEAIEPDGCRDPKVQQSVNTIRAYLSTYPDVAKAFRQDEALTAGELQQARSHFLNGILEFKEVGLILKEGRMRLAPEPVQLYRCPFCQELAPSPDELKPHIEAEHPVMDPEVPAGAQ